MKTKLLRVIRRIGFVCNADIREYLRLAYPEHYANLEMKRRGE
jgi:hypothetical protein